MRCLTCSLPLLDPLDGFYEWKNVLGRKIPYSIGNGRQFSVHVCRSLGGLETTDESVELESPVVLRR
jgi:hypothetical protein